MNPVEELITLVKALFSVGFDIEMLKTVQGSYFNGFELKLPRQKKGAKI
jgi:hypothetical protein